MNAHYCCKFACPDDAKWRIWQSIDPEDYTEACDEHLHCFVEGAPVVKLEIIYADE
jgi:hypothetical protein